MMDGFALRAAATDGASTYNPLCLRVVAEILPGSATLPRLQSGQAARIMTGAPLPEGADAVLPVEHTQVQGDNVWVMAPVPAQKHVGACGEDIQPGDRVLPGGRQLRPQDLGVLSSIGVAHVAVYRRPQVRIVITGNELLPSGSRPSGAQIVDANGPMLSALIQRDGGQVSARPIIPDREAAILAAMQDEVDVVLVSGGSSVGVEDLRPAYSPSTANWPFMDWQCVPAAQPAWDDSVHASYSCCRGIPYLACAHTISLPVERSAAWEASDRIGLIVPLRCHSAENWSRKSAASITPESVL